MIINRWCVWEGEFLLSTSLHPLTLLDTPFGITHCKVIEGNTSTEGTNS